MPMMNSEARKRMQPPAPDPVETLARKWEAQAADATCPDVVAVCERHAAELRQLALQISA